MKTLLSIMAHAEAMETFERNFPYWKEQEQRGAELLFWMPEDNSFKVPGHAVLTTGRRQHHGETAIKRFASIFLHMSKLPYDLYGFLEYDAITLGALPTVPKGTVMGNVFKEDSQLWKGKKYIHPPIFVESEAMPVLIKQMLATPFTEEQGCWDRWLGLVVDQADIPVLSFFTNGTGASRNTWEDKDLPALREAVLRGARFLHGIKSAQALKTVQDAWHFLRMQQELRAQGYKVEMTP